MHFNKKYIRSFLSPITLESPTCLYIMRYIDNLDLINLLRIDIIKYMYTKHRYYYYDFHPCLGAVHLEQCFSKWDVKPLVGR